MNAMPANDDASEANDIELPPVWSSVMDHAQVLAWAKDIKSLCQVEEVRVKGGAELHSQSSHAFSEAVSELMSHHVAALQIRYLYEGRMYFDTCLSEQGTFRLVRLLLPNASSAG